MNILKKYLSYLKDISLEKSSSEFNPHLEVLLVNGRHQLVTKDAIYSFDDKYINFYESFLKINWDKFKCKKVLVLGLGLGSVIYMLEKNLKKSFEYTAVEIDHEIVRLAEKYTLSKLNSYVETIVTDASHYIQLAQNKYDLILMDVFQSSEIPKEFQSDTFLDSLKQTLSQDGLLIYNRMNISDTDKSLNTAFSTKFEQHFSQYRQYQIINNMIYFSNSKFLL